MKQDILSIKIKPMEKSDVDAVIAIEEKAYGSHHWSKDSLWANFLMIWRDTLVCLMKMKI